MRELLVEASNDPNLMYLKKEIKLNDKNLIEYDDMLISAEAAERRR